MKDDDFMFNLDDNSCRDLIIKLHKNNTFYKKCINHGIDRKESFNWDKVISNFFKLINDKKTISIISIVKNNENWLKYFFNKMNEIENIYKNILNFEYFIYENNS